MRSRALIPTSVIAVAVVSLLAAGCGGGSSTTAATSTTQSGALAYSHCMHSHGVPNFPDPNRSGQIPKEQVIALDPSGPQFKAAGTACARLNPYGPPGETAAQVQAQAAAMLAFAQCMRGRGFLSFPDPTAQGELNRSSPCSQRL